MTGGDEVFVPPPDRPSQSGSSGQEENPSPRGNRQDSGNKRRRSHCTHCRAGVHDSHRKRTLANGKPFVNRFGGGRKSAAFTHSKKEPADRKHSKAGR